MQKKWGSQNWVQDNLNPRHRRLVSVKGGSMADNGCSCQSCGLDNLAKLFQKAMDAKTSTREAEWERSVYGKSVYSSNEIRDSDGEG